MYLYCTSAYRASPWDCVLVLYKCICTKGFLACNICLFVWFDSRIDSRIFPEGANSPLVFPKGGQPANQMGNGVFLKKTTLPTTPSSLKKNCQPTLHPLKKTLHPLKKTESTPKKKIEQGSSLGAGLFCSPPNHNNPGLQKCWEKTEYGEEWEGYLIWI